MDRKLSRRILIFISASSCISAVLITILILYFRGAFLPGWIEWDRDSREAVAEELEDLLDSSWLIQDALSFDIDGDGSDDRILLVWKRGSYGKHMPTWVRRNDTGFSQHIFIYSHIDNVWQPVWMSSGLGMQVKTFSEGGEISGTGRRSLDITESDGSVSRWGWLTWGLTKVE
ncbi:MAG: hypothetical protein IJ075_00485 [Lachnospiraceae bacterium]|nr:hypothetical protein [Lachnospiraceae bacterium]MBQ9605630.1 hypothetical protein [Lachnospiraceae bacterium]MBR1523396.1 hypothetical protein [Lachnospiraceae bacterium]